MRDLRTAPSHHVSHPPARRCCITPFCSLRHAVCRSRRYLRGRRPPLTASIQHPMSEKPQHPPRPSRPPPPALPEGWVAIWDEEYSRYYYANKVTKTTQWEVPTTPATTPKVPPPSYGHHEQNTSPVATRQQHVVHAVPVQTIPVQTVPVQTVPVQAVPVQTVPAQRYQTVPQRSSGGSGLMTGLVVGSLLGSRRRRRR